MKTIPVEKIHQHSIHTVFTHQLFSKRFDALGAIWQVVSVNPKRRTISLELKAVIQPEASQPDPTPCPTNLFVPKSSESLQSPSS